MYYGNNCYRFDEQFVRFRFESEHGRKRRGTCCCCCRLSCCCICCCFRRIIRWTGLLLAPLCVPVDGRSGATSLLLDHNLGVCERVFALQMPHQVLRVPAGHIEVTYFACALAYVVVVDEVIVHWVLVFAQWHSCTVSLYLSLSASLSFLLFLPFVSFISRFLSLSLCLPRNRKQYQQ